MEREWMVDHLNSSQQSELAGLVDPRIREDEMADSLMKKEDPESSSGWHFFLPVITHLVRNFLMGEMRKR
jgi:hypothetical protein